MTAGPCQFCGARYWRDEVRLGGEGRAYTECCRSGAVDLPPLPGTPPIIRDLLTSTSAHSREFRQNIRAYNGAFSFTSTYAPGMRGA